MKTAKLFTHGRSQAVRLPQEFRFEGSEVRPQVTGLIRKRLFTEGSYVHAGQPLFQIDPSLYQASVNQATANLAAAQATAEAASAKAERLRPLAQMEAVAQQDYTDALGQARQARAAVAQNRAALAWTLDEVNDRLRHQILAAADAVWQRSETDGIAPRLAAHSIAVERVAEATRLRGLYP